MAWIQAGCDTFRLFITSFENLLFVIKVLFWPVSCPTRGENNERNNMNQKIHRTKQIRTKGV